jgi:hypothetical protein
VRPPAAPDGDAEEPTVRMTAVYLTLATVVVISVLATILIDDVNVDRFAPNIATETLGIIVTVAFVQRFLERQERARRLRRSVSGLRKARQALERLRSVWADLVKGSQHSPSAPQRPTIEELFAPHVTEDLIYCDHRRNRDASGEGMDSWLEWAARQISAAKKVLEELLVTYGGTLDAGYLEVVDELVEDPFLDLIISLADNERLSTREWRVRFNTARGHREAHFRRLLRAIAHHNRLASEAARFRSRKAAPRTASVGVELPLDYDLRIDTELPPSWWANEPAPGSLCAPERPSRRSASGTDDSSD